MTDGIPRRRRQLQAAFSKAANAARRSGANHYEIAEEALALAAQAISCMPEATRAEAASVMGEMLPHLVTAAVRLLGDGSASIALGSKQ